MTSGIEAEMARFEEEVLGNDQQNRRGPPGHMLPDMPPPPFMQPIPRFDMMPGPMPGHGDMMMGHMGPGPMMMGPDPMMIKPKVYSAPPQITKEAIAEKRKVPGPAAEIPSKVQVAEVQSTSSEQMFSPSFANTYLTPRTPKSAQGGSQTPSAFSQATAASGYDTAKLSRKKKFVRTAAGQTWEDGTLLDWDQNDYRIFCGDLGNEVTDDVLTRVFHKYPSFLRARVIRDKHSKKSKGYGFVSFKDPNDFIRAMREMNGKYVGNRPIKLRKSTWKDRNADIVKKKMKEKKRLGYKV